MKHQMFRQGDISLILTDDVPEGYKEIQEDSGNAIIALGEVTGHSHVLTKATWLVDAVEDINSVKNFAATGVEENTMYVQVNEPTELVHQEHDTLLVPAGIYEIRRQREYSPEQIRPVMD